MTLLSSRSHPSIVLYVSYLFFSFNFTFLFCHYIFQQFIFCSHVLCYLFVPFMPFFFSFNFAFSFLVARSFNNSYFLRKRNIEMRSKKMPTSFFRFDESALTPFAIFKLGLHAKNIQVGLLSLLVERPNLSEILCLLIS